jgi:hypothetical protein
VPIKAIETIEGFQFQRSKLWSLGLIGVTFLVLLGFKSVQTSKFSPASIIETIKRDGIYIPLDSWEALPYACGDKCLPVGEDPVAVKLPALGMSTQIKAKYTQSSNALKLTHKLDLQTIDKIKQSGRNSINFVIPRSTQAAMEGQVGQVKFPYTSGDQLNVIWTIPLSEVETSPFITIFFYLSDQWDLFGPVSFPAALVDAKHSPQYAMISNSQGFLQFLTNEWPVLFAFSIALTTLVIDFSIPIFILSLYFAAFACRTFAYSFDVSSVPLLVPILFITNIAVFTLLCLFAASFIGKLEKLWKWILAGTAVLCIMLSMVFAASFFDTADLISDGLGATVAIGILVGGALREKRSSSFWVGLTFALLAFLFQIYANGNDLFTVMEGGSKSTLMLGHTLHFPLLLLCSLVELGSVKLLIERLAIGLADRREIEEGKIFQAANLPKNRTHHGDLFSWKVSYNPVKPLSGDWFDIAEIRVGSRSFVVGVVVDITGHGIVAAQHISAVLVAWRQAVADFKESQLGVSKEAVDDFLYSVAFAMNEALLSIPGSVGASSACFVIDLKDKRLQLLTNGHPGAVIKSNKETTYLFERNDRLGLTPLSQLKTSKAELASDSKVFVFSDGFMDHIEIESAKNLSALFESKIAESAALAGDDKTLVEIHVS